MFTECLKKLWFIATKIATVFNFYSTRYFYFSKSWASSFFIFRYLCRMIKLFLICTYKVRNLNSCIKLDKDFFFTKGLNDCFNMMINFGTWTSSTWTKRKSCIMPSISKFFLNILLQYFKNCKLSWNFYLI